MARGSGSGRVRGAVRQALRSLRRDRVRHLARLRNLDRRDNVHEWQKEQLAQALEHARREVPFHADRHASLQHWPLIDKETVNENFDALTARSHAGSTHVIRTSGSTGTPARFLRDARFAHRDWAAIRLAHEWMGYREAEGIVCMTRHAQRLHGLPRAVQIGREWFGNQRFALGYSRVDDDVRKARLDLVRRIQPPFLRGYPTALAWLAENARDEGVPIPALRGIASTGGRLRASSRELIEDVFGVPVFDQYGSRELGLVAAECRHRTGLHVFPDQIVEVIDEDGDPLPAGEPGRIVVTGLRNRVMPLIRYDTHDIGTMAAGECPCGRPWARLHTIEGRAREVLRQRGGTIMPPDLIIDHMVYAIGLDDVRQFQIIQEDYHHIIIKLVPRRGSGIEGTAWGRLEAHIQALFGRDCRVERQLVGAIPPAPSGKRLYSVCRVEDDRHGSDARRT